MEPEETDRRHHTRYRKSVQALVKINDTWEKADCFDISGGGICLLSNFRPKLDGAIELHIEGFGRFEGETIRHLSNGFVVRFSSSEHILKQLAVDLDNA
ncbi:hypothetical protein WH96_06995 [Kiloniella spongiae]|uniref:PilZ domain-containing protein n=1 Tax=Kiloniella spongiae TaxID=1489064 RepID=A0A0H2MG83_9PROT|nr:PilZ domain-containing protein [Kiloniella spongiae]KLN61383.1 hypothetical protein WH96_06995 [Kiloniella spongiae]